MELKAGGLKQRSRLRQYTGTASAAFGIAEMIVAMSLAGSTVVAGKMLTGSYSVFFIGAASMVFTLLSMIPFQLFRMKELLSLRRADLAYMFFQALFGIMLFRFFMLLGLRHTSALSAGIITSTGPAVLGGFAFLILKEKAGPARILSIVLAVAGVVLINIFTADGTRSGEAQGSFRGNILVLFAVISEALLTIFRKSSVKRVSSVTNTTVLSFFALLLFVPFLFFGKGFPKLTAMPLKDWLVLMYYGGLATSLAYVCWGDGAFRISAGLVGIITACMPLSSMILSVFVLGERLYWYHAAGAAVVLSGIFLGCKDFRKQY